MKRLEEKKKKRKAGKEGRKRKQKERNKLRKSKWRGIELNLSKCVKRYFEFFTLSVHILDPSAPPQNLVA
jgi:hypothetical protein